MTPDEAKLRAMLAGQALAGLCVNETHNDCNVAAFRFEQIAGKAVAYADAVVDRMMKTGGAL